MTDFQTIFIQEEEAAAEQEKVQLSDCPKQERTEQEPTEDWGKKYDSGFSHGVKVHAKNLEGIGTITGYNHLAPQFNGKLCRGHFNKEGQEFANLFYVFWQRGLSVLRR